jgi:hypothetical protein
MILGSLVEKNPTRPHLTNVKWQWVGSCDIGRGSGDALQKESCSLGGEQLTLEGSLYVHACAAR